MKKETLTESDPQTQITRQKISLQEAEAMLPEGDDIHTFRNSSFMLIGADWRRKAILAAIKKHGVELSGPMATRMDHGLVLFDENGPLFIATKKAPSVLKGSEVR